MKKLSSISPALKFIILLGIVSLFADMTYEGARSVTGQYLAIFGASATVVGVIGGLGEFVGYGVRIIFGSLADRTRRYWTITILGYILNLLAVPLIALTSHWEIAAILIIAERFGKAIRTPARDVMLSYAAKEVGRGWGFGIHEAMDQTGAVIGPIIVSAVLYLKSNNYSGGFAILSIPALLALSTLVLSRKLYPTPSDFERNSLDAFQKPASDNQHKVKEEEANIKFPRIYWIYLMFVAVSVGGYVNFQLISYHFKVNSIVSDPQIPILFAVAMGIDALVALIVGRLFDKSGLLILIVVPILSIPIAPLVFSIGYSGAAVIGMILWGAVMGIQDTVMRAIIANIAPITKRGLAYGIFNGVYGGSWFIGSTFMGVLYDVSTLYVIFFAIIVELSSFPLLFNVVKRIEHIV
ncbi:MAG TPA: MFS transporter [Nitrososphaeraceae archaeon]|nr:MFS transporter [Nitrososphaeraceae archaeon]